MFSNKVIHSSYFATTNLLGLAFYLYFLEGWFNTPPADAPRPIDNSVHAIWSILHPSSPWANPRVDTRTMFWEFAFMGASRLTSAVCLRSLPQTFLSAF